MADENKSFISSEALLNFLESLNETCCLKLQCNINKFLKAKVTAQTVFLIPLFADCEEAIIQVVNEQVLESELRFAIPNAVVQSVAECRGTQEIEKILQNVLKECNVHFFERNTRENSYFVVNHDTKPSFIVCTSALNPINTSQIKLVRHCFRFCSSVLVNALGVREEKRVKDQCHKLMDIAKNLFVHLGDLDELLREIMVEARKLTQAERCSLFLLSEDGSELVVKVLDGAPAHESGELRLSVRQGIAGHVATTGQTLNIRDVYTHPLFYKGVDEATGFKTRSILCFAIKDHEEQIVGVAELCNKKNGFHFDRLDEQAAEAFSSYCGISIMHGVMYKKIQLSQARNRLSNELMMYHMMVNSEDVDRVLECPTFHDVSVMDDVFWPSRFLSDADTPCFTLAMFESSGLSEHWRVRRRTLARFVLFVRKGYRDIPYHNWMHAFSVTHFAYCLLRRLNLVEKKLITSLEAIALLVSCLCHDLDHRGTTNSFQMKSRNSLACLYSSEGSVMERHHLAQTLCILNTQDCNVFESLSCEEYTQVLDLIRSMVLATDLAQHISLLPDIKKMCDEGYRSNDAKHRSLLLCLIMTCCDLNDQVKGWRYSCNIAEMIYNEFFIQGDMEKAMGTRPSVMMDRDLAQIPELQIEFLRDICLPCFTLLAEVFPDMSACVRVIKESLNGWQAAVAWFKRNRAPGRCCIELLRDHRFLRHVLKTDDLDGST